MGGKSARRHHPLKNHPRILAHNLHNNSPQVFPRSNPQVPHPLQRHTAPRHITRLTHPNNNPLNSSPTGSQQFPTAANTGLGAGAQGGYGSNLDRSASQRAAPKVPRNENLSRANTTKDRRSPAQQGPQGPYAHPSAHPSAPGPGHAQGQGQGHGQAGHGQGQGQGQGHGQGQLGYPSAPKISAPTKSSPGSSSSDLPLKGQLPPTPSEREARDQRERERERERERRERERERLEKGERVEREKGERTQGQPSAAAASLAKAAGGVATPRRREKKEKDKANEADIVKRLQQICTDADPTRLYRNLVKIGQG